MNTQIVYFAGHATIKFASFERDEIARESPSSRGSITSIATPRQLHCDKIGSSYNQSH